MWLNTKNPRISWIGTKKTGGDEWVKFTKKFLAKGEVKSAAIRAEADCTCAMYINDSFIGSTTGRYAERVNCHEITSKIKDGENVINLVLGGPYFQTVGNDWTACCNFWFSMAAVEVCIEYKDGTKQIIATDSSWEASYDGKTAPTTEGLRVTDAEYDMMWKNASQWLEPELHKPCIPTAVTNIVGMEYADYANAPAPEFVTYEKILFTNMKVKDGVYVIDDECEQDPYITFDFGRLVVGFTELAYECSEDTSVVAWHDFTEDYTNFDNDSKWIHHVKRLSVTQKLSKDENVWFNLRRRAFRYLRFNFSKEAKGLAFKGARVRVCMMPQIETGWFKCNDEMLNTAWEIGKYTLQVNKQQEYESCPRREMQFFTGDGAVDAMIDQYAFGNTDMMNTSLSIKHDESCTGVQFTNKFNKTMWQWDYFPWRIICVYNHYKLTGDKEFLQRYFEESKTVMEWLIERIEFNNLIFQKRCFVSMYDYRTAQMDWTCSNHRLGEYAYNNNLLYKSLNCMAEFATILGKKKLGKEWKALAVKVKDAINERLWSEEKQSYMDTFMDDYIAQDNNVTAILFDVADDERKKAILKNLKENLWSPYGSTILNIPYWQSRGGNTTISPAMSTHEAEAHFLYGDPADGMELMRRLWGTMIKKGAHTFWEYCPNNDTDKWDIPSHAWSGGCTYLLSAYVLGIKHTSPNYKTFTFKPNVCDLTEMKGVVPTANGFIAAAYEKVDGVNKFRITYPKGLKMEYVLPENSTIEIIKY